MCDSCIFFDPTTANGWYPAQKCHRQPPGVTRTSPSLLSKIIIHFINKNGLFQNPPSSKTHHPNIFFFSLDVRHVTVTLINPGNLAIYLTLLAFLRADRRPLIFFRNPGKQSPSVPPPAPTKWLKFIKWPTSVSVAFQSLHNQTQWTTACTYRKRKQLPAIRTAETDVLNISKCAASAFYLGVLKAVMQDLTCAILVTFPTPLSLSSGLLKALH